MQIWHGGILLSGSLPSILMLTALTFRFKEREGERKERKENTMIEREATNIFVVIFGIIGIGLTEIIEF